MTDAAQVEIHEFEEYKKTGYCGFSLSRTPGHRCGKPRPAHPVHQTHDRVESPARDTAETRHLLQCLAEECAEVIQACSKALRFGLDDDHQSANPDIVSPRLYIVRELADVDAVYLMLTEREVLPEIDDRHRTAKIEKLTRMMEYAREKGML